MKHALVNHFSWVAVVSDGKHSVHKDQGDGILYIYVQNSELPDHRQLNGNNGEKYKGCVSATVKFITSRSARDMSSVDDYDDVRPTLNEKCSQMLDYYLARDYPQHIEKLEKVNYP